MVNTQTLKAILIPALVFQSVVIAGGYGTGRELVEFFLSMGPWGGLLGMLTTAVVWSFVCAITFEFARRYHAYNYRDFFQCLLGRAWVLFEGCYLLLALIVLGVIASSAGNILSHLLGTSYQYGVIAISSYICLMVWRGSRIIERAMSFWSIMLYIVFSIFLVICLSRFGEDIVQILHDEPLQGEWLQQGIAYAGYNLGLIPAVLFAIHHCKTKSQAFSAGILAGVLTILPGIGFFVAMCAFYPTIIEQTVPSTYILQIVDNTYLTFAFHLVLLGTITETGTGVIHAINQRMENALKQQGKTFSRKMRPLVAMCCLAITFGLSQLGLETLIAKGYGTITWLMILVYVLPILTIGLRKLRREPEQISEVRAQSI